MKIIGGYYEKEEVEELIGKSSTEDHYTLKVLSISEKAGWVDILLMYNNKKISIKYSSVMTDTADLFQFLVEIVELQENVVRFLDNEGSLPMLYVEPINPEIIRYQTS